MTVRKNDGNIGGRPTGVVGNALILSNMLLSINLNALFDHNIQPHDGLWVAVTYEVLVLER